MKWIYQQAVNTPLWRLGLVCLRKTYTHDLLSSAGVMADQQEARKAKQIQSTMLVNCLVWAWCWCGHGAGVGVVLVWHGAGVAWCWCRHGAGWAWCWCGCGAGVGVVLG